MEESLCRNAANQTDASQTKPLETWNLFLLKRSPSKLEWKRVYVEMLPLKLMLPRLKLLEPGTYSINCFNLELVLKVFLLICVLFAFLSG